MKKTLPIFLLFLLFIGCTTASTKRTPSSAAQSEFKNLQVLPKDITRDQLLATMRGFTRGLGVRCNFCHVVTATEPKEQLDFASDAKKEKHAARVMIQMVSQINGTYMPRTLAALHETPAAGENVRVSCWTCHRGKAEPETPPPPPAQR